MQSYLEACDHSITVFLEEIFWYEIIEMYHLILIQYISQIFFDLALYSIITAFVAFEISCFWKYYGKWSIKMLSKSRKWCYDLKIAYGVKVKQVPYST